MEDQSLAAAVVSVIGCCVNLELEGATKSFDTESEILSSIQALILKYMPNGSLEEWLHYDSCVLDLVQRLNIATDVALALEYLHHGHTFPVVQCFA
ncbi:hypothetical protein ACS0TY_027526 [Phlomoides rotata]